MRGANLYGWTIICLLLLNIAEGKTTSYRLASGSKDGVQYKKSFSNVDGESHVLGNYEKDNIPTLDLIIGNNNVKTFLKNPVTLHEIVLQSLLKNGEIREVNIVPLSSSEKIVQNHLDNKHEELHALIKEINIRKEQLGTSDRRSKYSKSLDSSSEQEESSIEQDTAESDQSSDSEYMLENSSTVEDDETNGNAVRKQSRTSKLKNLKQDNPSQKRIGKGQDLFDPYNVNVKLSEALNDKMRDLYQLEYLRGKNNRLKRTLQIPEQQIRNKRSIYENWNKIKGLNVGHLKSGRPLKQFLRNDKTFLVEKRNIFSGKPNTRKNKIVKGGDKLHQSKINNYLQSRKRKRNLRKIQDIFSYPSIRTKRRENKLKNILTRPEHGILSKQKGPVHLRISRDIRQKKLQSSSSEDNDSREEGDESSEEVSSKSSRSFTFDWYNFSKHLQLFDGPDFSIINVLKKYFKNLRDQLDDDDAHKREKKNTQGIEPLEEEETTGMLPSSLQSRKDEESKGDSQKENLAVESEDDNTTMPVRQFEKETPKNKSKTYFTIKRKSKIMLPLRIARDEDGKFTVQLDVKNICSQFIRDKAISKRILQKVSANEDEEQK